MHNEKSKTTEHTQVWETGTYQTGSAKPKNEHRGIIAILMILVTFLGGIASVLGLINIHLLQELTRKNQAPENVSVYMEASHSSVSTGESGNDAAPSLPSRNHVDFRMEDASEEIPPEPISPEALLAQNAQSVVSVHSGSVSNEPVACGVIIDEGGFLITNAYPIADGNPIYVLLSDGRSCRATLVGIDEFTDLAVLYIDAPNLTAAQFACADALEEGSYLACICAQRQITEGQLHSAAEYPIGSQTLSLLQTDLETAFGPVYNAAGRIVGFSSPFLQGESGAMAIPSSAVKDVVEQIIVEGTIAGRPCLGVELEEVQPLHQHYWQLPCGLRITRIAEEEAQLDGLLQGDILISLNGQPISDRESLYCVLRTLREGDRVTAIVVRDNVEMTLELTIQVS